MQWDAPHVGDGQGNFFGFQRIEQVDHRVFDKERHQFDTGHLFQLFKAVHAGLDPLVLQGLPQFGVKAFGQGFQRFVPRNTQLMRMELKKLRAVSVP